MSYDEYDGLNQNEVRTVVFMMFAIITAPIIAWKIIEWLIFPKLVTEGIDTTRINPIHDVISLFSGVDWKYVFLITILMLILLNICSCCGRKKP